MSTPVYVRSLGQVIAMLGAAAVHGALALAPAGRRGER